MKITSTAASTVCAGVLLGVLVVGLTAASAQAAQTGIGGTQYSNVLVYGDIQRYHPAGTSTFRLDGYPLCLGGEIRLGLFHSVSQGQVTSTLASRLGVTKNFTNLNGSTSIASGYYGVDSRMVGGCAGKNSWSGLFSY
ncbi:hypothetical protein KPL76_05460 [Subtercola sp. PAMC28395]|uniref:hypothetical protein n=1 Tax=Subtercola sp. PAMC28395 TaxID=2846775 RepID=UPI001C0E0740|nr:hypothetical protein [Subtercola sp. PAMC28395]QWT24810.1 hypothetical protein KPL76_05460 [Subtercola sp. PAMC28395]